MQGHSLHDYEWNNRSHLNYSGIISTIREAAVQDDLYRRIKSQIQPTCFAWLHALHLLRPVAFTGTCIFSCQEVHLNSNFNSPGDYCPVENERLLSRLGTPSYQQFGNRAITSFLHPPMVESQINICSCVYHFILMTWLNNVSAASSPRPR